MNRARIILSLLALAHTALAELPDLLRFSNDDQLRGSFVGMRKGPELLWKNEDLTETAAFKTDRVRHVVLRGGRPKRMLETLSHVVLSNEDRIPGIISGLDAETLTLETTHSGRLRIPRKHVAMIAPNPLGGRISYHGPFAKDGWTMRREGEADAAGKKESEPESGTDGATKKEWEFSGSAWYWRHEDESTALVRESGMPDQSVLRFELGWKNRLGLFIALHADFAHPKPLEKNENKRLGNPVGFMNLAELPQIFGNSYIIQIQNSYMSLLKSTVDADGKASVDRPRNNGGVPRLDSTGRARFEIRSNRRTGEITIFINDEFVTQWNDDSQAVEVGTDVTPAANEPQGVGGFGFITHGGDVMVRISDIVLTEWNGMPDSARSMQMNDQDVVLMTNGTDRFSGRLDTLDSDGSLWFEGRHGRFHFPLEDVAEVRFAKSGLAHMENSSDDHVRVVLAPLGRISGQPVTGDDGHLEIINPAVGRMNLSLESAVMMDFNTSIAPIDDWNADF